VRPIRAGSAILALLVTLGFCGCAFPSSRSYPIVISTETITLEWDPPSASFPSPPLATSSYSVYVSRHGSYNWVLLGWAQANGRPHFTIHHSDLGDGLFDFAVRAHDSLGKASPFCTSADVSASPFGGWYLVWRKSD
jgi:hypothetical protein